MFTRILVPLDGSELAERAVPVAARIARYTGATMLLVRVVPPSYLAVYEPAFGAYPAADGSLREQDQIEAQAYLISVSGWPVLLGVPVEKFPIAALAAPGILQLAEEQHADLVVITSHGRTGLSRWVLGSVAQHLARHSNIPILVLRATEHGLGATDEETTQSARVLVTLDGSQDAEAALAPAADLSVALSSPAGGELHLLVVVDTYLAAVSAAPAALLIGGAEGFLGRVAERLQHERGSELHITWSVSTGRDIAGAILEEASQGAHATAGYDVIVMASHGRTGFARWALGSVTERVLHGTELPLLVVRPQHISGAPSSLAEEPV